MSEDKQNFPKDSAGRLVTEEVLVVGKTDNLADILKRFEKGQWAVHFAFVLDETKHLIGMVDLMKVSKDNLQIKVGDIMFLPKAVVRATADQSQAILAAVRESVSVSPVVDKKGTFIGAIPANRLIKAMHAEHIEEALMVSGVSHQDTSILKITSGRYGLILKSRLPWLVFGALAGLGLGVISSLFEENLRANVALAYFIPVVAYIADSVGTQAEAITIRSLALTKISYRLYIWREFLIGSSIGVILGIFGGVGAFLISQSSQVSLVVALSLLSASTIASVLAAIIPIVLKKFGKDPALGSGPLATALQDVFSVIIYFVFALLIVR